LVRSSPGDTGAHLPGLTVFLEDPPRSAEWLIGSVNSADLTAANRVQVSDEVSALLEHTQSDLLGHKAHYKGNPSSGLTTGTLAFFALTEHGRYDRARSRRQSTAPTSAPQILNATVRALGDCVRPWPSWVVGPEPLVDGKAHRAATQVVEWTQTAEDVRARDVILIETLRFL